MVGIIVVKGDLSKSTADAVVNPANSQGWMGGGVAYALKRAGGRVVEEEAVSKAPISVGSAVETTGGSMSCRYVIHAPTMTEPAEQIGLENVRLATAAALEKASELGVESLAFPGMGCGVGGVPVSDAARAMVERVTDFNPSFTVYLVGFDDELTEAFRKWAKLSRETG